MTVHVSAEVVRHMISEFSFDLLPEEEREYRQSKAEHERRRVLRDAAREYARAEDWWDELDAEVSAYVTEDSIEEKAS